MEMFFFETDSLRFIFTLHLLDEYKKGTELGLGAVLFGMFNLISV